MQFKDMINKKELEVRLKKLEASKMDMELNRLRMEERIATIDREISLQAEAIEKIKEELSKYTKE